MTRLIVLLQIELMAALKDQYKTPSTRFSRTLRILMEFYIIIYTFIQKIIRYTDTHTHVHDVHCNFLCSFMYSILIFLFFLYTIQFFWCATIIICPMWFSREFFFCVIVVVRSHFVIDIKSVCICFSFNLQSSGKKVQIIFCLSGVWFALI